MPEDLTESQSIVLKNECFSICFISFPKRKSGSTASNCGKKNTWIK